MATKGTAGKSASGASMSKYDVEVEGRLQALEAQAHAKCDGGGGVDPARVDALEKRLQALVEKVAYKLGGDYYV
jgi:hypothetical protein